MDSDLSGSDHSFESPVIRVCGDAFVPSPGWRDSDRVERVPFVLSIPLKSTRAHLV
jgi:hypothetical protein